MFVHCISINTLQRPKSIFSIIQNFFMKSPKIELPETLYKEIGNHIPRCFQEEGGMGLSFVFCVDTRIDIKEICNKYNYDIGDNLYKMEIDNGTYNNNYKIYPTYTNKIYEPKYILKSVVG